MALSRKAGQILVRHCPSWLGALLPHQAAKAAAKQAKEKGLDCFSTTLLVSPYQNQELLKKIGDDIAAEEGIRFYYEDFRPGFRKAHDEAKAKRVYCQKYCGCIYSELERYTKSKK